MPTITYYLYGLPNGPILFPVRKSEKYTLRNLNAAARRLIRLLESPAYRGYPGRVSISREVTV